MMKIVVIKGDGIGPEVIDETLKILDRVGRFEYEFIDMGGCSIDKTGEALTKEALDTAKAADAVLLGAVGGPKWDNGKVRPEDGLLAIRKGLGVYANLRPSVLYEELKDACPLKDTVVKNGVDMLIVRELTGGIYFGEKGRSSDEAYDVERYSEAEIIRILRKAAEAALRRKRHVTVVDKANILESSRLWRSVSSAFFRGYPQLEVDYMYVDNAAMQLIKDPSRFDVIVTSNMFGDILSDEASMLTGSIGMLPSASLGDGGKGLYEPIHGSAPDIAGTGLANPIASVLSAAMMLEYSFDMKHESDMIVNAVRKFLSDGHRTRDLTSSPEYVTTAEAGSLIAGNIGKYKA